MQPKNKNITNTPEVTNTPVSNPVKPSEVQDESNLANRPETNIPQTGVSVAAPGSPISNDIGGRNSMVVPPYDASSAANALDLAYASSRQVEAPPQPAKAAQPSDDLSMKEALDLRYPTPMGDAKGDRVPANARTEPARASERQPDKVARTHQPDNVARTAPKAKGSDRK